MIHLGVFAIALIGLQTYAPPLRGLERNAFLWVSVLSLLITGLGVILAAFYNDSVLFASVALRQHVLFPLIFAMVGFSMARLPVSLIIITLCASGFLNILIGYIAITTTPLMRMDTGNWAGGLNRIWMHPLSGKEFWATVILMNSVAAGIAGMFFSAVKAVWQRLLCITSLSAFMGIGILSGTRGGVIALATGFVLVVFRSVILNPGRMRLIGALLLLIVGISWIAMIFPEFMVSHAERFLPEQLFDRTATGRTDLWNARLSIVANKPLGVGFEGSLLEDGFSAHNTYIELLFSYGWLAGGAFIVFCLLTSVLSLQTYLSKKATPGDIALVGAMIAFMVYGMVEAIPRSSYQANFIWSFIIGMFFAAQVDRVEASRASTASQPARPTPHSVAKMNTAHP